ncbi:MAG: CoA-binding domain protein [Nocardioides sp.]|nr:CoA-binding domain protein [Nocardioides sp.]
MRGEMQKLVTVVTSAEAVRPGPRPRLDGMGDWQDPEAVRFMLDDCETWAVVGLSGDPGRTAYSIAALLQSRGKRIVPVHPSAPTVLGEQGYATLADVPFPIDVVDVFRRSEAAGDFADQAVAVGARAVWFQLGVVDEAAFDRTVAAGVPMVMDTCPAIEWRRRE